MINDDVFNTLRGFGFVIKMFDDGGIGPIADPKSARYLFAQDRTNKEQNVMIRLPNFSETEFPTVVVYKTDTKSEKFVKLFLTLKNIAITSGYSITVRELGSTIEPKMFSYNAKRDRENKERINEQKTTTIKDMKEKLTNSSNLEKTVEENGWKEIAYGHFSKVYEKDGENFVIKINRKRDNGYELFLSVVRANKNKHFPTVYEDFIANGKDVYFIENLEPSNMSIQQMDDIEKYYNYIGLIYFDGYQYAKDYVKMFRSKQKSLADAIELLRDAADESEEQMIFDSLNIHNFMKRKDGTLVIIDPFVEGSEAETEEDWDDSYDEDLED